MQGRALVRGQLWHRDIRELSRTEGGMRLGGGMQRHATPTDRHIQPNMNQA